jgi:hypothetical protein
MEISRYRHRLWACIVAFGDALSQEDPQDPQDPLNLPEDSFAFFSFNPSNIYNVTAGAIAPLP